MVRLRIFPGQTSITLAAVAAAVWLALAVMAVLVGVVVVAVRTKAARVVLRTPEAVGVGKVTGHQVLRPQALTTAEAALSWWPIRLDKDVSKTVGSIEARELHRRRDR